MSKKIEVLKNLWNLCKNFIPGLKTNKAPKKNVSRIYSKRYANYSPAQQEKLEKLCEDLFEQKGLITTGKLQFLGLGKVKKRLGKTWEGLKPIVFNTVEEAISKYLLPKDIFIRYKDDTYVIIFAEASPEEAQIKATLIAEEVRRQLFEHEEEELRNIDVVESVSIVKTKNLKKSKNLLEAMDIIMTGNDNVKLPDKPKKPVQIQPTIEIDPYVKKQKPEPVTSPQKTQRKKPLHYSYVPLWEVKKKLLTTYLCLAQDNQLMDDPFDGHEMLFIGQPTSVKTRLDIQILNTVMRELEDMLGGNHKVSIACPVHYETLINPESHEKYILKCQKIPKDHKKFLIFLVWGLPETIHDSNVRKFFGALKNHGQAMYAQLPLNPKIDFHALSSWHFDVIGVRLKKATGGERQMISRLNEFSQNAKKVLIKKVFALDVVSLSVTTSAVCADFDFLGGPAIHEQVPKPNRAYHFIHQDLFADLFVEKTIKVKTG